MKVVWLTVVCILSQTTDAKIACQVKDECLYTECINAVGASRLYLIDCYYPQYQSVGFCSYFSSGMWGWVCPDKTCSADVGYFCNTNKQQAGCAAGFTCGGGIAQPVRCPIGSHNKGLNESCRDNSEVTQGYYLNDTAELPCPAGFMCTGGLMVDSTPCPLHTFSKNTSIDCRPCPTDSFTSNIASSECTQCPHGKFADRRYSELPCILLPGFGYSRVNAISNGSSSTPLPTDKNIPFRQYLKFLATKNIRNTLTFLENITNFEILLIGGGGSGAPQCRGGGGAGALISSNVLNPITNLEYVMTVGLGGKSPSDPQATQGNDGGDTLVEFNMSTTLKSVWLKALGGGGGGRTGGCGGGSIQVIPIPASSANIPTNVFGFPGGGCITANGACATELSPGGGGASAQGAADFIKGSMGGNGVVVGITGNQNVYAGGGAGSTCSLTVGYTTYQYPSSGGGGVIHGTVVVVGGDSLKRSETDTFTPIKEPTPDTGSGGASGPTPERIVLAVSTFNTNHTNPEFQKIAGSGADGVIVVAWDPNVFKCLNGTFNTGGVSLFCEPCKSGSYSSMQGTSTCQKCDRGTFSSHSATSCLICGNGNCTDPTHTKKCTSPTTFTCCGQNTYFVDGESTACMPCAPGSFSLDGTLQTCTACPTGSLNVRTNASHDTFCVCDLAQGLYLHNNTLNTCLSCPENHYCSAQQVAIPCPPGSHRIIDQLPVEACQPCNNAPIKGNFSWANYSVCTPQCDTGFYSLSAGEDQYCLPCDQNISCSAGGCIQRCSVGMYMPVCEKGSTAKQSCAYCPTPAPSGAVWTNPCEFKCDVGLFYNASIKICKACSKPKCPQGKNATICNRETDSVCEACTNGPLNGDFQWKNGTCLFSCSGTTYYDQSKNQTCTECSEGSYRSSPTNCLKCTATECNAGTYRTNCGMGEVSDSSCAQCMQPQGPFGWTAVCNFTCKSGYYLLGNVCTECSQPSCTPGKFATKCTELTNSVCNTCTNPHPIGGFTYMGGCNFTCDGNTYFNSVNNSCSQCPSDTFRSTPTSCSRCVVDNCLPGLNRTRCSAGSVSNSQCLPCTNSVLNGEWTSGCGFVCKYGLYYNTSQNLCLQCNMPECNIAGQHASPCSDDGLSMCIDCTGPASGAYEWITGCTFACSGTSYFNSTENACKKCGNGMFFSTLNVCSQCKVLDCTPGNYKVPCGSTTDTRCDICTNAPANDKFTWTADCSFACTDGLYYSATQNQCILCTLPQCQYGMRAPPCTDTVNNPSCIDCNNRPIGSGYTWMDNCTFECDTGKYYSKTLNSCLQCDRPICPLGQSAPQCTDQINKPTCKACPVKPTGSFNWTNGCSYICTNGTYNDQNSNKCVPCNRGTYLSSQTGCSTCNTSQCSLGLYRAQCPSGTATDAECFQCKTTVTGPFSWTSQCAFVCVNQTYLTNGAACVPCKPSCTNGSFVSSQCTATSDTKCSVCDVIPQPKGTFDWEGGCNFQCRHGFVWNGTFCSTDTMVFVETTTSIALANTEEEVCANRDGLVSAVVLAMQVAYNVPFSGELSTINNKNVTLVCGNSTAIKRRLLQTQSSAQIETKSNATVSLQEANLVNTTQSNNVIQKQINANGTLRAIGLNTLVDMRTSQPSPESNKAPAVDMNGELGTGITVLGVILGLSALAACFKWRRPIGFVLGLHPTQSKFHIAHQQYTLVMPKLKREIHQSVL